MAVEDRGRWPRRHLSLPGAVAAYYRALFLNVTLPGGVVGDVHRGISHGRDVNDVGHALRAVAWERTAGQVVQVLLTVVVLLALPSPVQSAMPLVLSVVFAALFGVVFIARARPCCAQSAWARTRTPWPATYARGSSREGRGCPSRSRPPGRRRPCGHVPDRGADRRHHRATSRMLPIALLVVMGMVLPNIGKAGGRVRALRHGGIRRGGPGCGPRIATAVVDGLIVLVACSARRGRSGRGTVPECAASETDQIAAAEVSRHMHDRPYTCPAGHMFIDGAISIRAMPRRLELSNDADFDRVDASGLVRRDPGGWWHRGNLIPMGAQAAARSRSSPARRPMEGSMIESPRPRASLTTPLRPGLACRGTSVLDRGGLPGWEVPPALERRHQARWWSSGSGVRP